MYANNTPCFGRFPTISGTRGNDVLEGTRGRDIIQAAGGDDVVRARRGRDLICTGGGDDVVGAGRGHDRVRAGPGTNAVNAGRGRDVLRGGRDVDVLSGGGGADRLVARGGDDFLDGGARSDTLIGGPGSDLVTVVTGRDVRADLGRGFARGRGVDTLRSVEALRTGSGDDLLKGTAGANLLMAGSGDDTLLGRGGDDILIPHTGADVVRGGSGTDMLSYALTTRALRLDLNDGDGTEDLSSIEALEGSQGADVITGTTDDDLLLGSAGDDTFFPAAGDDEVNGGPGFDAVDYRGVQHGVEVDLEARTARAQGNDTLIAITRVHGTAFDDVLLGSSQEDTLWGYDGADRIEGRDLDDGLDGGAGDDELSGGGRSDRLRGGDGDDVLRDGSGGAHLEGGPGDDRMIASHGGDFFPGPGNDLIHGPGTLHYGDVPHGVHVDLVSGVATAEGTDTVSNLHEVRGTAHADTLLGTPEADRLSGSGGDDRIEGRAGDDQLHGFTGNDTIDGNEGDDYLHGDHGDDPLDGGPGVDHCSQGQPMVDCEYVHSEYEPAPSATHTPPPSEQPGGEALGSTSSVALQVDPSHSGGIEGAGLVPPLRERWSVDLGGRGGMSYPVAAEGRVFVTVPNVDSYGSELYALDATDGSILWSHQLYGVYWSSWLVYESGRLFSQNHDGTLTAYDPASGSILWSRHIGGQGSFPTAPVVHDGEIYTAGAGFGGTLYKIAASDGQVLWRRAIPGGHEDSPTLSSERVFIAHGCGEVHAFLRDTGDASWTHETDCSGTSVGNMTVRYGTLLYVKEGAWIAPVDPRTGAPRGYEFISSSLPAFARDIGVVLDGGRATARHAYEDRELWTFPADGKLAAHPLIVDGVVYLGSSAGRLYGVGLETGAQLWTAELGAPIASRRLSGLGVAPGVLFVPSGTRLIAFEG